MDTTKDTDWLLYILYSIKADMNTYMPLETVAILFEGTFF